MNVGCALLALVAPLGPCSGVLGMVPAMVHQVSTKDVSTSLTKVASTSLICPLPAVTVYFIQRLLLPNPRHDFMPFLILPCENVLTTAGQCSGPLVLTALSTTDNENWGDGNDK